MYEFQSKSRKEGMSQTNIKGGDLDPIKGIILVSGYVKSGKDVCGSLMETKYHMTKWSFAKALKNEAAQYFGISRDLLDTHHGKDLLLSGIGVDRRTPAFKALALDESTHGHLDLNNPKTTVRQLLIAYGTYHRRKDGVHWARILANDITFGGASWNVVTDWRYPNEYDHLAQHFGKDKIYTWRLDRWSRLADMDPSETSLDGFPMSTTVQNRGSLTEFIEACQRALRRLPLPFVILDVDDVLLHWMGAFKSHIAIQTNIKPIAEYPDKMSIEEWLNVDLQECEDLITSFNNSRHFGSLKAYDGALEFVNWAIQEKLNVVALTSCSNAPLVVASRKENLTTVFGDNVFSEIVCLPLGASKRAVLSEFNNYILFDDNVSHVKAALNSGRKAYLVEQLWNLLERQDIPERYIVKSFRDIRKCVQDHMAL